MPEINHEVLLAIYGEGREKKLSRLIRDYEACIKLAGYADRNKLIEVLPQYDVFSLMSTEESFGLVYIEAMPAGFASIERHGGWDL